MTSNPISIRPFLGAANFNISRHFYHDLGFEEVPLSPDLSLFKTGNLAFYLQNAYVKDWIDNTMVFMEVEDADQYYAAVAALGLTTKYEKVKLSPVRTHDWGKECFLHDPSGILWHFGTFAK